MAYRYDLTRLRTRQHFITFLGIGDQMLDSVLAFEPPPDPKPEPEPGKIVKLSIPTFFRHKIPKKNKARGYRIAWEPSFLKPAYKKLGRILAKFFEYRLVPFPHPATFGYIGGRNIKGNAEVHCGHRQLLSVDIEAFFPTITQERVQALLLESGFCQEMAELIAGFVTIDGHLPLGLPTSPVLSNAVFLVADKALQDLAATYGASYSRYSDDMSFSGDGALPEVSEVEAILGGHGFALAASKTRRSMRGQAHYVTGLSVSESDQPHAPKRMKRRLRQELYYAKKFGLNDHLLRLGVNDANVFQEQLNRLDGTVKYVAFHEPRLASRIKPQWGEILQEAGERASFAPRRRDGLPFYICIDEAEFQSPKGPVLALGLAVTQHPDLMNNTTHDVLHDTLGDLYAAGDVEAIRAKGLHFADATQDLRLQYVERLSAMPFEGYVVMGRLERYEDYEATYLRLLGAVIKRRLMAAESQHATFVVEKNNKVAEDKIRALVTEARDALKAENNRRPAGVGVVFVTKPSLPISVPDFLLGILGLYLQSKDPPTGRPESRDRLLFERIRDKYRLILNVDDWSEFSRRRPIAPWCDGT